MERLRRSFALPVVLAWLGTLAPIGGCTAVGGSEIEPPSSNPEMAAPPASRSSRILGLSTNVNGGNDFVSLDPVTGEVTDIASLPEGYLGDESAYDAVRRRYLYTYRTIDDFSERMVTVDAPSGATLADVAIGEEASEIAVDESTGDVLCHGPSEDGQGVGISRIDPITGERTQISTYPQPASFGSDMAFNGHDVYYRVRPTSSGPDALALIFASTGALIETPLSSGKNISNLQYDLTGNSPNRLFGLVHSPGNITQIIAIKPSSGVATVVATMGGLQSEVRAATFDPVYNRYFFTARVLNPSGGSMVSPMDRIITVDVDTGLVQFGTPPIWHDVVSNLQFERKTPTTGLMINEIDYDQVGTDSAEYVEIKNGSDTDIDLAGYELVLVNGAAQSVYRTVDLGPAGVLAAGEYLVVGSNAALANVTESAKTISLGGGTDYLRNGAPDGAAIVDTNAGVLSDAISYGAAGTTANIPPLGVVSLVEGTRTPLMDSNTSVRSLCRQPDGVDTNHANVDWALCMTLTPGAPN